MRCGNSSGTSVRVRPHAERGVAIEGTAICTPTTDEAEGTTV